MDCIASLVKLASMADPRDMELLLLDDAWRPRHRLRVDRDWPATMAQILALDCRWLALRQSCSGDRDPAPHAADIVLTRALCRRLRPLEIQLADHVIDAGENRFSFRAAGLL